MPTTSDRPACTRCGMCCLLGSCGIGEENGFGICEELVIHDDLTTSCRIIDKTSFKGTGCALKQMSCIAKLYTETYDIDEMKREILKLKKARRHAEHRTNRV